MPSPGVAPELMKKVKGDLPLAIFERRPSRLGWACFHSLGVAIGWVAVVQLRESSALLSLPLSLLIGLHFAGLAFVAHETLHGSTIKGRRLRRLVGGVCFAPFCLAPKLWIAWHNRVHHGHTNVAGRDPDAYPTQEEYEKHAAARWAVELAAPGLRRWRGVITLLIGFSLQSAQILVMARRRKMLDGRGYALTWAHSLCTLALWSGLGVFFGGRALVLGWVLPLLVANAVVMSFIITNHSLSPMTEQNDALRGSLSVSVPRWLEIYTLGFGFHVEHHLFPTVNHAHGAAIQKALRRHAPEEYQCMPFVKALRLLFTTPRVYLEPELLGDPRGDARWETLGKRTGLPSPRRQPDLEDIESQLAEGRIAVLDAPSNDGDRNSSIPPPPCAA